MKLLRDRISVTNSKDPEYYEDNNEVERRTGIVTEIQAIGWKNLRMLIVLVEES